MALSEISINNCFIRLLFYEYLLKKRWMDCIKDEMIKKKVCMKMTAKRRESGRKKQIVPTSYNVGQGQEDNDNVTMV